MHTTEIIVCCILVILIASACSGSYFVNSKKKLAQKEFQLIVDDFSNSNSSNFSQNTVAPTAAPAPVPDCWTYVPEVVEKMCADSATSEQCSLATHNKLYVSNFIRYQSNNKFIENDSFFGFFNVPQKCRARTLATDISDNTKLTTEQKATVLAFFTKYDPQDAIITSPMDKLAPRGLPNIPLYAGMTEGASAANFEISYLKDVNDSPPSDLYYDTPMPPFAWNGWLGKDVGFRVYPPGMGPERQEYFPLVPSEKPDVPHQPPCAMISNYC